MCTWTIWTLARVDLAVKNSSLQDKLWKVQVKQIQHGRSAFFLFPITKIRCESRPGMTSLGRDKFVRCLLTGSQLMITPGFRLCVETRVAAQCEADEEISKKWKEVSLKCGSPSNHADKPNKCPSLLDNHVRYGCASSPLGPSHRMGSDGDEQDVVYINTTTNVKRPEE